ncbi:hypothetical protein GCM10025767_18590 [Thalassotalea piscium]
MPQIKIRQRKSNKVIARLLNNSGVIINFISTMYVFSNKMHNNTQTCYSFGNICCFKSLERNYIKLKFTFFYMGIMFGLCVLPLEALLAKSITPTFAESVMNTSKNPKILPHQAKALKQIVPSDSLSKTIEISVVELTDNQGLVYLGGVVNKATVAIYLAQLKNVLNDEFVHYRQNQMLRDHGKLHLTLINPYEYQNINKEQLVLDQRFTVNLHGLGRVEKDKSATYFVVASSEQGQRFRQGFLLKQKDFHITLGFKPSDIYSESKDINTLIK